jgi:hypothetical protein
MFADLFLSFAVHAFDLISIIIRHSPLDPFRGISVPVCSPARGLSGLGSFSMASRSLRHYDLRPVPAACALIIGMAIALAPGCVSENLPAKRFSENLKLYPGTEGPLRIARLSPASANTVPAALRGKAVIVIVHPAYSLFFREDRKSRFTEAKYDLLKFQLDREARFISEIAKTGNVVILILPGNYLQESIAPLSYTAYLNATAGGGRSVYYVDSDTASSGDLPTETMVTLYGFLRSIGTGQVLLGGGYIGRCQKEFYSQMVTYVDRVSVHIVPEISSLSPDDISDKESRRILDSLRAGDYSPVREFIRKKMKGTAATLPLPELQNRL